MTFGDAIPVETSAVELDGNRCEVHRYHWPPVARTVHHHVIPLEFGGPDEVSNKVLTCDTGHYNIHARLEWLLGRRLYSPKVTRKEAAIAARGAAGVRRNQAVREDRP
ncbi:MAG TPA: HNH endonuclease signature motif containing protein [Actinomycetota bacterium]|nr:HNH endonuclease signature motif containing protein [Actinomycetota bacterium]